MLVAGSGELQNPERSADGARSVTRLQQARTSDQTVMHPQPPQEIGDPASRPAHAAAS